MPQSSKTSGKLSTLHIMAAVWILIAVVIVMALLFAPRKPDAPPKSRMAFEKPPEAKAGRVARTPHERPVSGVVARADKAAGRDNKAGRNARVCFRIYGTVTDRDTGEPVEGASIRCEYAGEDDQKERTYKAVTDENGQYEIAVRFAGEYGFRVRAAGYAVLSRDNVVLHEAAGELRKNFELYTGAQVSGRVRVAGTGAGALNVRVFARGSNKVAPVHTDEYGAYTLAGFDAGTYTIALDLQKAPYVSAGAPSSRPVIITYPDKKLTGIDFEVEEAGIVWGYVLGTGGKPVEKADLLVCKSSSIVSQIADAGLRGGPPLHARSGADGYYELVGVPFNQEWHVYATSDAWAPQLSDPFMLTPNHRHLRLDLFMSGGTNVYGRVVDAAGNPIPDAGILCIPAYNEFFSRLDSPHAVRGPRSDDAGRFVISNLPRGRYQIIAQKQDFKLEMMGEPVYPDGYSDIRDVEIVLTRLDTGEFTVYGTVTDTAGRPVEGAELRLRGIGPETLTGIEQTTTSGSGGAYRFDGVPSGFLVLVASKDGYAETRVSRVQLDAPTNITLEAQVRIAGRVFIKETDALVENFRIQAVLLAAHGREGVVSFQPRTDSAQSRNFNDGDGRFEMMLRPGEYQIEVSAPGLTTAHRDLDLEPGDNRDDLRIYLRQAGGSIEGRVVAESGGNVAGAIVWLGREGAAGGTAFPGAQTGASGQDGRQVGDDGRFEFTLLPAGRYTVFARADGYAETQSEPIRLSDDQSVTGVQVVLGRGGTLTGYVVRNGQRQPEAIVTVFGNNVTRMASTDENGDYRIDNLPAGRYQVSAQVLGQELLTNLLAPELNRIEIFDGETTVFNIGEISGGTITGLCTPPPPITGMGYALLHEPGVPIDLSRMAGPGLLLRLRDPQSLLNMVAGMAEAASPVSPEGDFRLTGISQGEHQLDIIYAGALGEVVLGELRPLFSTTITVEGEGEINLGEIVLPR